MTSVESPLLELANSKLTRVFGAEKAARLMKQTLAKAQLQTIISSEDLLVFSEALQQQGGFEATVGALLALQAVMHGARKD